MRWRANIPFDSDHPDRGRDPRRGRQYRRRSLRRRRLGTTTMTLRRDVPPPHIPTSL